MDARGYAPLVSHELLSPSLLNISHQVLNLYTFESIQGYKYPPKKTLQYIKL